MPKKNIIIVSALILVAVIAVIVLSQFSGGTGDGVNATNTAPKPLTIQEQKDLLIELAKPPEGVKPLTQSEQVKLLEELAKPVAPMKTGTSSVNTSVTTTPPQQLSVEEQMNLLESLKAK